jgi:arsenite-transporting ATPase
VPGLQALNIDPEAAALAYRERVVGPYRGVLPASAVARIEEQLSGACTLEIAAFDAFTALLSGSSVAADVDHVIFDTAPTGHTLRLLALPAAWTGFIDTNTTGTSCLGPLAGLEGRVDTYRRSLEALKDPAITTVVLVARPDTSPIAEAARTSTELSALGVTHQRLVVNGVFTAAGTTDALAAALDARGRAALATLPGQLRSLSCLEVPLGGVAPMGVDGLRAFGNAQPLARRADDAASIDADPLDALVDAMATRGRGVIFTMGKGGVGKTTIAAAIAVRLADRGHEVHLTTTDPAAHLAVTIGADVPRLTVARIDPAAETRAYSDEVLATAGAGLDAHGRALLEEDLRSPCTEEIAVFRAFARAVDEGTHGFVVLDTAPTGHTLLLLDAAEAYHREVARASTGALPDAVSQLLPRLRDPQFTRVLLVTVPEATPVHEAAHLQADLVRAGITPFAWVVNQSLAAAPGLTDPLLRLRAEREQHWLEDVRQRHATRMACVPMVAEAPVGADALRALSRAGAPARA